MICSKSTRVKHNDKQAKPSTIRLFEHNSQNETVNDHPVTVPASASAMQSAHLPHLSFLRGTRLGRLQLEQPGELF